MTELTSTAQGLFASPPPAAQPTRADLLDTLRLWPPAMPVGMVAPKSVTSIRGQTYPTGSRPEPTEPWRATTVHPLGRPATGDAPQRRVKGKDDSAGSPGAQQRPSIAAGATFMTRDTTRRPLLAASLTVTVTGSALTYWRHRRAVPLALSVLAAVWVYSFVYVVGAGHGGHMTDHMGTEVHRVFVS